MDRQIVVFSDVWVRIVRLLMEIKELNADTQLNMAISNIDNAQFHIWFAFMYEYK